MVRNILLQPFKLSFNLNVYVSGLGVRFLFLAAWLKVAKVGGGR